MSLDLEKGYTRVTRHQGGLAAGRPRVREIGAGDVHAVRPRQQVALCGVTVLPRPRDPWRVGSMETLCPGCEPRVRELEAAETSADA